MMLWVGSIVALLATAALVWVWLRVMPRMRCQQRMRGYDLAPPYLLPPLPKELDRVSAISSRVKPLLKYRVNLYRLSCTCTSFRQRRGCYPDNDIHRLCRHLRAELQNTRAMQFYDELTQRIIQDRVRDKYYHRVTLHGIDMAFGYHPRSHYMRIFTRRAQEGDPADGPFTGPYDKYVFNLTQENWVYGETPPGNSQIIATAIMLMERIRPLAQKLNQSDQPEESVD